MDSIEVTATFDLRGNITPQRFVWQERVYPIVSTGRNWQDSTGYHILVMVPNDTIHHLVYEPVDLRWYIHHPDTTRSAA